MAGMAGGRGGRGRGGMLPLDAAPLAALNPGMVMAPIIMPTAGALPGLSGRRWAWLGLPGKSRASVGAPAWPLRRRCHCCPHCALTRHQQCRRHGAHYPAR